MISDIILSNESKGILLPTILYNNKKLTKKDFEEAQKLIKNCSREEQLILIAIIRNSIIFGR